ncbi:hypothetical protein T492DRAFT_1041072 [Pavlovales sp. CCMP2436]|nr:hypothetical protein T492DRAFT_1041072 [Pavlovales sp. CCMP2436]
MCVFVCAHTFFLLLLLGVYISASVSGTLPLAPAELLICIYALFFSALHPPSPPLLSRTYILSKHLLKSALDLPDCCCLSSY